MNEQGRWNSKTWDLESSVFWDITQRSPLKINRSFGGTFYFTTGGLPPISSSWRLAPWDSRPAFFQLNTCFHSPYVTSALKRGWVCSLKFLLVLARAIVLRSDYSRICDHIILSSSIPPQPGGPGPRIYIPQEQGSTVVLPGTGFPFRRLLRLLGLDSNKVKVMLQPMVCRLVCFGIKHPSGA
jgi:hypothetical protein